jgi:uncharacterized protein (UPF0548 family)
MAEWRFGRGWSETELESRLEVARKLEVNISETDPALQGAHSVSPPWKRYYSEAVVGLEKPGKPESGGVFERLWDLIKNYEFSDPGIVRAHFDPRDPLLGRTMLLEIQVLGLRYLCASRITLDRDRSTEHRTVKGFRYDTLKGHIERGSEWFLLTKNHETGEVIFRIHASWKLGDFPNWWSHLGFILVAERYQLAWHRLAYLRLREVIGPGRIHLKPVPRGKELLHTGTEVEDADLWVLRPHFQITKVGALGGHARTVAELHQKIRESKT